MRLELIEIATGQALKIDEVQVTVNVDRVEQQPGLTPDLVAEIKDARHLRGFAPHHLGLRMPDVTYEGIRAIRGQIVARVPTVSPPGGGWRSRHTPMQGRKLRLQNEPSNNQSSGSSIWVGLKQGYSDGSMQWVQAGLRWLQTQDNTFGSAPATYLETADTYKKIGAKSLMQVSGGSHDQLGQNVIDTDAPALDTWDQAPVRLTFVLFKKPVATNENGDIGIEPWHVVFRDARSGATISESSHIHMSLSKPTYSGSVGQADATELENRYKAQAFMDMDALFETNQTIAFAPGTMGEKAVISNLAVARGFVPDPDPMPLPTELNGKTKMYNWANTSFSWEVVSPAAGGVVSEIKTGRSLANGDAEQGTITHPDWHAGIAEGSLQIWDDRSPDFHEDPE